MLRPALTLLVLYRVVVVRSNRFAHVSDLLLPKRTRPGERSEAIGFRCAKGFPAVAPVRK
jgi:hypothetical protein